MTHIKRIKSKPTTPGMPKKRATATVKAFIASRAVPHSDERWTVSRPSMPPKADGSNVCIALARPSVRSITIMAQHKTTTI